MSHSTHFDEGSCASPNAKSQASCNASSKSGAAAISPRWHQPLREISSFGGSGDHHRVRETHWRCPYYCLNVLPLNR